MGRTQSLREVLERDPWLNANFEERAFSLALTLFKIARGKKDFRLLVLGEGRGRERLLGEILHRARRATSSRPFQSALLWSLGEELLAKLQEKFLEQMSAEAEAEWGEVEEWGEIEG